MQPESNDQTPTQDGTPAEQLPTGDAAPSTETPAAPEMGAEESKWKAMSRKTEEQNAKLTKELEQLRKQHMSESERAIAEAEARGAAQALSGMQTQLAEAKLRAAAAGKVADVDAFVEIADLAKFITAEGVDDAAIAATVDRFAKVAPAVAPPKYGSVDLGPQGGRPQRQLTRDDLKSMTDQQINEARRSGLLDSLLKV
jgi:hypothetical protein